MVKYQPNPEKREKPLAVEIFSPNLTQEDPYKSLVNAWNYSGDVLGTLYPFQFFMGLSSYEKPERKVKVPSQGKPESKEARKLTPYEVKENVAEISNKAFDLTDKILDKEEITENQLKALENYSNATSKSCDAMMGSLLSEYPELKETKMR